MSLQNIETNLSIFARYVWVEDFGFKLDTGWLCWVVRRDSYGEGEDSGGVKAGRGASYDGGPFREVFSFNIPWTKLEKVGIGRGRSVWMGRGESEFSLGRLVFFEESLGRCV